MLGETKKSFKIIGWCIVALTIVLAINYFVYDSSFANGSGRSPEAKYSGKDHAFWYDDTYKIDYSTSNDPDIKGATDIFGSDKQTNLDLVLDSKHATSDVSYNSFKSHEKSGLITYNYKIKDIYMDFDPSHPDKLRVFYKTWNADTDPAVYYTFYFHFDVYDKNKEKIWGWADRSETRIDRSDNDHNYDHETFDARDNSDFKNKDGHYGEYWKGANLRNYVMSKLYVNGGFENFDEVNNMSLKKLVEKGYFKVTLTGLSISM